MSTVTISTDHLTKGVTSPFLPGTNIQYALDSTSIGYLKTCARLYQYIMLEGWSPRENSVHLRFGIEYHSALQDYAIGRASGHTHEDAIRDTIRAVMERVHGWVTDETTKAGKYKNTKTLLSLIVDYLDKFGADDPAQTIILDNGNPAVELSFRFELEWGPKHQTDGAYQPYLLSGHLDRAVDFNGSAFVMDHKTATSTIGTYYFDQYNPSNQMSLYSLAGKIVLDAPIKGVIIAAAQILLEKPNAFQRGFTYRTDDQLDEWLIDLRAHLENAERYAENDHWPMNDTACGNYGGCRFREVCSKSPSVRETYLKSNFDKLPPELRWNPLKERDSSVS